MPERWWWDAEDEPRHLGCKGDGEMTFFRTLMDEEVAMCHACMAMDFDLEPAQPDGNSDARPLA